MAPRRRTAVAKSKTPICANCGQKFPGDPCLKCKMLNEVAEKKKAKQMPRATRKSHKRRHGRATRSAR
jgi:hypothetical protein